jgi:hypothetical protein
VSTDKGAFTLTITSDAPVTEVVFRVVRTGYKDHVATLLVSQLSELQTIPLGPVDPIDEAVQALGAAADCNDGMPQVEAIGSVAINRQGKYLARAAAALVTISGGSGTYSELERVVAARCLDRVRLNALQKDCSGLSGQLMAELSVERTQIAVGKTEPDRELLDVAYILRCQRKPSYIAIERCDSDCGRGDSGHGLTAGDVVLRANGAEMHSRDDWTTFVSGNVARATVQLEIATEGQPTRPITVSGAELGPISVRPASLRELRFLRKR